VVVRIERLAEDEPREFVRGCPPRGLTSPVAVTDCAGAAARGLQERHTPALAVPAARLLLLRPG
jgi:hypothetical protein